MSGSDPFIHHPDEGEEYEIPERCRILETWNRKDDPFVSIARAEVAAGITTRLHRLAGITERYYIISGSGLVELNGRPPKVVVPGDLVFIPPQLPPNASEIRVRTSSSFLLFALHASFRMHTRTSTPMTDSLCHLTPMWAG